MDLKFTFGASNPLPLTAEGAGSASASGPGSSVLELRVTLADGEAVCEGVSGDGASYARATKRVADDGSSTLAAAVRSVLARAGAELPEPLLGSVTGVVLSLGGADAQVLADLGLVVAPGASPSDPVSAIDEALQARTGLSAGTPIHIA